MESFKLIKSFNPKDYLNNVLPVLSLDISEVTFIYRHEIDKDLFERNNLIIKKYKDISIKYQLVNSIDDLDSLIDKNTIIDVSGVSYVNLILFDYSLKSANQIIYYNSEDACLIDYRTHKVINNNLFKLSIEDIITLGKGEILNHLHSLPTDKQTCDLIIKIVTEQHKYYSYVINYINKVNKIVNDSGYHLSNREVKEITTDIQYSYLYKYHLFSIDENNKFTYLNSYIQSIFESSGILLESFTYLTLKNSNKFDDVAMSIRIDFSKKHNHEVLCELDGLALKDNKLVFISCKSNKVDNLSLYEIYGHNNVFGNKLSKPCVVTVNDIEDNLIYEKASELGITVIDEGNIIKGNIVEKVLKSLGIN